MMKKIIILGLMLVCFLYSGCYTLPQSNTPVPAPSLEVTSVAQSEKMDFLGLCNDVSTLVPGSQEGYKNIFPGVTLREDVKGLIGQPDEISKFESGTWVKGMESWVYADFGIWMNPNTGKVDSINVNNPPKETTIYDVVKKYGCPNFVYALNQNEEFYGYYSSTILIYSAFGIRFDFNEFPMTRNSKLNSIIYYDPEKGEEILTEWDLVDVIGQAVPVQLVK